MLGDTLLLNYLNFQKIKINGFYEIILGKTDLVVKLEFFNRRIQPDWFPQIKLIADGIQRIKDHLCPGQRAVSYTHLDVYKRQGLSTPAFYLGLMLMLVVCVKLQWLPITPQSTALSLILPTVTLSSLSLIHI